MGARDRIAKAIAQGIRAYHGSPHDFDKFDIRKIGSGEGNQTYGHGLYFAGNENVARTYRELGRERDRLIGDTGMTLPGWMANRLDASSKLPGGYEGSLSRLRSDFEARLLDAQAELKTSQQPWNVEGQISNLNRVLASIGELERGARLRPAGHMYEVNIHADPAAMLSWDRPMREQMNIFDPVVEGLGSRDRLLGAAAQSEKLAQRSLDEPNNPALVNEFLSLHKSPEAKVGNLLLDMQKPVGTFGYDPGAKATGQRFYEALNPTEWAPWEANKRLQDVGVPGIKYLDQGSRARGEGTHNYVMFDDKGIDIKRKYGLAGATAVPVGMGALAAQDQYEVQ